MRSRRIGWRSRLAAVFRVYNNQHFSEIHLDIATTTTSTTATTITATATTTTTGEKYIMRIKKGQLWDRGFCRDSYLQAVWDTSVARTTGFTWSHQGCHLMVLYGRDQNLTAVELSACTPKYEIWGYGYVHCVCIVFTLNLSQHPTTSVRSVRADSSSYVAGIQIMWSQTEGKNIGDIHYIGWT